MICKYCGRENSETENLKPAYLYRLGQGDNGLDEIPVYIDDSCREAIYYGNAKAYLRDDPCKATYVARKPGKIDGKWESARVWFYRRHPEKAAAILTSELNDKLRRKMEEKKWLDMDIAVTERHIEKLQNYESQKGED